MASVIVPAASRSSVLKSRPFNGNELTAWLESFSPPVPVEAADGFAAGADGAPGWFSTETERMCWSETVRSRDGPVMLVATGAVGARPGSATATVCGPIATLDMEKRPSGEVIEFLLPEGVDMVTVAFAMG